MPSLLADQGTRLGGRASGAFPRPGERGYLIRVRPWSIRGNYPHNRSLAPSQAGVVAGYGGVVALSPHVPGLGALELFVAVARYGSIGAAARHAGISQQAASARLRAMEAQVGTVLLDRDPRGSRLTPAGALLVDWAAPLLAQAGELDSGIASLRRARDAQLRVAASLTIAEHLLPAWLVALRDEYERAGAQPADITLLAANSEAVAAMVAEHGVDLGFVEARGTRLKGRWALVTLTVTWLTPRHSACTPEGVHPDGSQRPCSGVRARREPPGEGGQGR